MFQWRRLLSDIGNDGLEGGTNDGIRVEQSNLFGYIG